MNPYPWLEGKDAICDTCRDFKICGRSGWLCGNWTEADELQIAWRFESGKQKRSEELRCENEK